MATSRSPITNSGIHLLFQNDLLKYIAIVADGLSPWWALVSHCYRSGGGGCIEFQPIGVDERFLQIGNSLQNRRVNQCGLKQCLKGGLPEIVPRFHLLSLLLYRNRPPATALGKRRNVRSPYPMRISSYNSHDLDSPIDHNRSRYSNSHESWSNALPDPML